MSCRRKRISRSDASGGIVAPEHGGDHSHEISQTTGRLADAPYSVDPPREIDVLELLGDRREVVIIHSGHRYRLRIASANKLILTK